MWLSRTSGSRELLERRVEAAYHYHADTLIAARVQRLARGSEHAPRLRAQTRSGTVRTAPLHPYIARQVTIRGQDPLIDQAIRGDML